MNRNGWIGKVFLVLAVLLPIGGFALSVYLSTSGTAISFFSPANSTASEQYILTGADFPEALGVGNRVGYRIPDFELALADGSQVSSAALVEEQQPTFLFFWATY